MMMGLGNATNEILSNTSTGFGELFAAILVGILSLSSRRILRWFRSRKAAKVCSVYQNVMQVYPVLAKAKSETGACRATILSAHNGGRDVTPTSARFISVIYEHNDSDAISVQSLCQNQPMDRTISEFIAKALANGVAGGVVSEIESSRLRGMLDHSKVEMFCIHPVYISGSKVLFLQLDYQFRRKLSDHERVQIDAAVGELSKILQG